MSIITSDLYDCYENIIGLSKTPCTCEDPKGDFTLSYNTSESGIFLDELAPLNMISGLEKCEWDLWEIMDYARDQGIRGFVRDGFQALQQIRKLRRNAWSGGIGKRRATADRLLTDVYAGVHWFVKSVKSGTIKITKIYTLFNFTGNVTLWVYDQFNTLHATYVLNTVEDTFTENDITDLELPMYSEWTDNIEYFFVYTVGANLPRNNTLGCTGCTRNAPTFSPNRPGFYGTYTERNGWANYVMIGGFETDTLEFEINTYGGNNYMNGLGFEAEFRCNIHELFCMTELDYESDPLAVSIAFAIRYKAAIILADMIFASGLNHWSLINREYLAVEQKSWQAKYEEIVTYIANKVPITRNDCWQCDDDDVLVRKPILI